MAPKPNNNSSPKSKQQGGGNTTTSISNSGNHQNYRSPGNRNHNHHHHHHNPYQYQRQMSVTSLPTPSYYNQLPGFGTIIQPSATFNNAQPNDLLLSQSSQILNNEQAHHPQSSSSNFQPRNIWEYSSSSSGSGGYNTPPPSYSSLLYPDAELFEREANRNLARIDRYFGSDGSKFLGSSPPPSSSPTLSNHSHHQHQRNGGRMEENSNEGQLQCTGVVIQVQHQQQTDREVNRSEEEEEAENQLLPRAFTSATAAAGSCRGIAVCPVQSSSLPGKGSNEEEEEEEVQLAKSRQVEQMQLAGSDESDGDGSDEEEEEEEELETEQLKKVQSSNHHQRERGLDLLNSSSLSDKVQAHSANHSLVKQLLVYFRVKFNRSNNNKNPRSCSTPSLSPKKQQQSKKAKRKQNKQSSSKKSNSEQKKKKKDPRDFQRQDSKNDRLENIMQRITLYSAFAIVCLLIVLVVGKIVAQNDADSKRLLMQQQTVQTPGKLDLTKFEHLKQTKNAAPPAAPPSERLEERVKSSRIQDSGSNKNDKNRRLLTSSVSAEASASSSSSSASISLMEKFRQGLDSWIVPTGFTGTRRSTTPKPGNEGSGGNREIEWAPRVYMSPGAPSGSSGAYKAKDGGQPEVEPKQAPQQLGDTCANCIKENYLAHYYQKGCKPVRSRECDCAKFFRCPRKPVKPKLTKEESVKASVQKDKPCVYGDKVYGINERIPNPDEPCRVCRCRKRQFYNGTITKSYGEIDCSLFVECPEMVFGVKPKRESCHFAYRHDQCCGTEICTDELPREDKRVRTTCKYRSKSYKYGEMIYPEENSCMKCICDETWNEHDPASSGGCKARQCSAFLQENILQKCTPIYRIDGCCPIDFMCPEKRKLYDREEEEEDQQNLDQDHHDDDEQNLDKALPDGYLESQAVPTKCYHDGLSYALGQKMYVDRRETQHGRTCARCECKVPPMLTCQADFRCTGSSQ